MSLFKSRREMGLVSRKITVPKKELRSMHGIGDRLLIYLGVGRSLDGSLLGQIGKMDIPDASFLVSEGLSLPPWLPSDRVVRIPQRETETQNYIAMCDLVVSKTGYSTVSEAIRGQVPMLLFHRQGYLEDKLLAGGVEALGIGREITVDEFIGGDWDVEEAIGFREAYRSLPERMVRNGNEEAVMAVREALA
jgi:hypothetical protein